MYELYCMKIEVARAWNLVDRQPLVLLLHLSTTSYRTGLGEPLMHWMLKTCWKQMCV